MDVPTATGVLLCRTAPQSGQTNRVKYMANLKPDVVGHDAIDRD
jgi:hypothetical protein